jgi:hypothetical protein
MCVSQRFCVASPVATYRGLFAVYRELRVAFKATYRELVAVYVSACNILMASPTQVAAGLLFYFKKSS